MVNNKIIKKTNKSSVLETCQKISDIYEQLKKNRGTKIAKNKKLRETEDNDIKSQLKKEINDLDNSDKNLKKERDKISKSLEIHYYKVLDDIKKIYSEMGYTVYINKLICSDYGGYTFRKRLFIVAVRNDINIEWEWPVKTHSKNGDNGLPKWKTVRNAFDLLDENLNSPENDVDNRPMNHRPKTVEYFKTVTSKKKGGSFSSRGTSKRLAWDEASPTLVPGHSSFQIHPKEHRSITVREGATITGFPLDYKFQGNHSSRCMQIGNAIPVNLSTVLAKSARTLLEKYYNQKNIVLKKLDTTNIKII